MGPSASGVRSPSAPVRVTRTARAVHVNVLIAVA